MIVIVDDVIVFDKSRWVIVCSFIVIDQYYCDLNFDHSLRMQMTFFENVDFDFKVGFLVEVMFVLAIYFHCLLGCIFFSGLANKSIHLIWPLH